MIAAVAIVSRSGLKPLLVKTNGLEQKESSDLMVSFAKSFDEEASFFETAEYRFLYQPIDSRVYVVLVSVRHSNVVQDLEVIHLLAEALGQQFASATSENDYVSRYEVALFVIDEVISFGVPNLPLTAAEVTRRLTMFSVVEEMEKEERKVKEDSARKFRREREMRQQTQKAKQQLKKVVKGVRDIAVDQTVGNIATVTHHARGGSRSGARSETSSTGQPAVLMAQVAAPRPAAPPSGPPPSSGMTLDFGAGMDAQGWD